MTETVYGKTLTFSEPHSDAAANPPLPGSDANLPDPIADVDMAAARADAEHQAATRDALIRNGSIKLPPEEPEAGGRMLDMLNSEGDRDLYQQLTESLEAQADDIRGHPAPPPKPRGFIDEAGRDVWGVNPDDPYLTQMKDAFMGYAGYAGNLASTLVDTVTIGQSPVLVGALNVPLDAVGLGVERKQDLSTVLTDLIKGGDVTKTEADEASWAANAFANGYYERIRNLEESRAELGPWISGAVDVYGATRGLGAPRLIDKAVAKYVLPVATRAGGWSALGRVVRDTFNGAAQTALQNVHYWDEDDSKLSRYATVALGGAMSGLMQPIIGRVWPWLNADPGSINTIKSLGHTGAGSEGHGHPSEIGSALDELEPGQGFMNIGGIPGFKTENILTRAVGGIAKLIIPDGGNILSKNVRMYNAKYAEVLQGVHDTFDHINAQATQEFHSVVGTPRSSQEISSDLAAGYAPVKNRMNEMSKGKLNEDGSMPEGMTPVDLRAVTERIQKTFADTLDRTIETMDVGGNKAMNTLLRFLRRDEVDVAGRKIQKADSDGKKSIEKANVLDVNGKLHELLDARKRLVASMDPGVGADGLSQSDARDVFKLVNILDDEIAAVKVPDGKGGWKDNIAAANRAEYAHLQRIEDWDAIGYNTYKKRGKITDPEKRKFYDKDQETLKAILNDNPTYKSALENGAQRAQIEDVRTQGFGDMIADKLGDMGTGKVPDFLTSKLGPLEDMNWMFGKKYMDGLIDLHRKAFKSHEAITTLRKFLDPDNMARVGEKIDPAAAIRAISGAANDGRGYLTKSIDYTMDMIKGFHDVGGNANELISFLETLGNNTAAVPKLKQAADTLTRKNVPDTIGTMTSVLSGFLGKDAPEPERAAVPTFENSRTKVKRKSN